MAYSAATDPCVTQQQYIDYTCNSIHRLTTNGTLR